MRFDGHADSFYENIGFKCGLEVHQQLATEKKLFCRCPVGLKKERPNGRILRHMRPTLSELGEYDGTALMEFKTRKDVIYELFSSCTCTYEMDDTPPFPINKKAVDYAIEIALMLHCTIVDEIHITRKQYLDGSIPTGFQRTAIIGVDGWIPYKGRKITVPLLTLEEDACREVSDVGHVITFKTDRLSTPLVEVITGPDMRNPQEVMDVNRLIAAILRSTGKVRRGIGTVRQDVNVSITGGSRVEIKGVPRISMIGALTHYESLRQAALLKLKDELAARNVTADNFQVKKAFLASTAGDLRSPFFSSLKRQESILGCIKLEKMNGVFSIETQPGKTFADEVSGRLRVIACLDQLPNMASSDIESGAFIEIEDWELLKNEMNAGQDDLLVLTWGEKRDVETALEEIKLRVIEAIQGVPNETRQALPGGITDFERILPGPDRMYPDTDSAPTVITARHLEQIKGNLPEHPLKRRERYGALGLSDQAIKGLERLGLENLYDAVVASGVAPPGEVGEILAQKFRALQRKGYAVQTTPAETVISIFRAFPGESRRSSAFMHCLEKAASCPGLEPEKILKDRPGIIPDEHAVLLTARNVVDTFRTKIFKTKQKKIRFLVGQVMKRVPSSVPGRLVAALIHKELGKDSSSISPD